MDNELMALMQVLSNKPYLTLKDIELPVVRQPIVLIR